MTLKVLLLAACCLPLSLAGCASDPTPTGVSLASPTVASPTPTPSATVTAVPTLPTATSSLTPSVTATDEPTATSTPSSTPSLVPSDTAAPTATATPSSTSTPTPSLTPTQTNTSGPPTTTITPTQTMTPTVAPTITPTPLFTPTPMPTVAVSGDWEHFLLMGLDSTRNLRGQNTDVIIVAAVNKDTKQVSMLSIPRDLWVYIPTYGWNRINTAHKFGYRTDYPGSGPGLLAETIKVNFGIPIDHWGRIDFQGFARVVDKLGGVEMVVPCPINLRYVAPKADDENQEENILEPGVYQMDGATALKYVRTRRGSSDFDRAQRQHQFLRAMWHQFKSPDLILKLPGLWSALKDSFETDLKLGDVLSLAPVALDIEPQRIRSRYIGANQTEGWHTSEGWSVLLPHYDQIQKVVASLYGPPTPRDDEIAQEGARVRIWNGTYRQQLARMAADQVRWYGVKVEETGLADNPNYKQSQILVFSDKPKTLELLVNELDVRPENVIHQPDPNQPVDIQVILGEDYDPCQ